MERGVRTFEPWNPRTLFPVIAAVHHKRKRAKHRRAGCLLCKPFKRGGQSKYIRIKGLIAPRRLSDLQPE
jgi:hypothetical protein